MNVLIVLLVGIVSGWVANILIDGHGLGALGDILFALAGAFFSSFIYSNLSSVNHSFFSALLVSIGGAVAFVAPIALLASHPNANPHTKRTHS